MQLSLIEVMVLMSWITSSPSSSTTSKPIVAWLFCGCAMGVVTWQNLISIADWYFSHLHFCRVLCKLHSLVNPFRLLLLILNINCSADISLKLSTQSISQLFILRCDGCGCSSNNHILPCFPVMPHFRAHLVITSPRIKFYLFKTDSKWNKEELQRW